MEVEQHRGTAERELVRRGWARETGAGQIEAASAHLLAHLGRELGDDDARTYLVDLALKTLLLGFEFRESEIEPVDLAEDRLMAAYEGFELDERRVVAECLAGADAGGGDGAAELEDLQYEQDGAADSWDETDSSGGQLA